MKKESFKVGVLVVGLLVLWVSLLSCSSGPPAVSVNLTLMDNAVPLEQQSKVLVPHRILLNAPVQKPLGWSLYILPTGEHTFSGEYTLYEYVRGGGGTASYRVLEVNGSKRFSISHNFQPGQFYYIVGSEDEDYYNDHNSEIMILTEEELSVHFSQSRVDFLKQRRMEAEKQL